MSARAYLCFAALACLLGGCGKANDFKYRVAVIPKGLTHEFWQSIHRGALRAAADLKAQYTLAYSSTHRARDGAWRAISLKVKDPDLEVQARAGYYAPGTPAR